MSVTLMGCDRWCRRGLVDLDVDVEQVADRLLLDRLLHRLEELEALALVLDERVALGHRAQADALLQVVHLVEVLAPLAVQHREHDTALHLAHDLGAELLLARVVGVVRVGEQLLAQVVGGQGTATTGGLDDLLGRERDRVQRLESGPEALEVPVVGEALGGLGVDVAAR